MSAPLTRKLSRSESPATPPSACPVTPPDNTPNSDRWVEAEVVCSRSLRDTDGNRFELGAQPVGRGTFGEFFVAKAFRTGGAQELVGLKRIPIQPCDPLLRYSEYNRSIEDEARAMLLGESGLGPKTLLMADEAAYIETALCDGTLAHARREMAAKHPECMELLTISMLKQVCQNLEKLHARGWVHRDIKPDNILFLRNGEIHLGDYGRGKHRTAQRGPGLATFGYMSPQAARRPCSPADDIWSLGASALKLLMGWTPFDPNPYIKPMDNKAATQERLYVKSLELHERYAKWLQNEHPSNRLDVYFSQLQAVSPRLAPVLYSMLSPFPDERISCATLLDRLAAEVALTPEEEQKLAAAWQDVLPDARIAAQKEDLGAQTSEPLIHSRTFDGIPSLPTGWVKPSSLL